MVKEKTPLTPLHYIAQTLNVTREVPHNETLILR